MSSRPQHLSYAVPDARTTVSRSRRVLRFGLTWLSPPIAAVVALLVGVGVSQALALGVLNGLTALAVTAALIVVAGAGGRALRAARARRVLTYVEQSVRLSMPVPEFLAAAARSEDRFVARRLRDVAASTSNGTMLADALRGDVPELPRRITDLLRVATDNGALATTLARLIGEPLRSAERDANRRLPWLYFAVMIVALPAAVVMLCVFMLPKWTEVLRRSGVPLSPLLRALASVDVGWYAIALVAALLGIVILLAVVSRSVRWLFIGRHDLGTSRGTFLARIAWHLPIVGALARDRDHADVCHAIADGLAFGRPINVVLAEAGGLHVNAVLGERLRVWRRLAEGGLPLAAAARAAKMPGIVAGLAGDCAHASAEAFAFLARHYESRAMRRGDWLAAAAMPTMTLIFGAIVGAVTFAVFDAIARLLDATTPYPIGV